MKGTWEDRLWAKITKSDDCWEWTAGRMGRGYGAIKHGGRMRSAHRVMWELANGPIPKGLFVLHRCDNPLCVRPDHLFLGTQADNMRDCAVKGRTSRNERHGRSKLLPDQVREIRARQSNGETHASIASRFGVSEGCIDRIINGKNWRYL